MDEQRTIINQNAAGGPSNGGDRSNLNSIRIRALVQKFKDEGRSIPSDGVTAKSVTDAYLSRFRNLEGIGAIVELMPDVGGDITPQRFGTEVKLYYDNVNEAGDNPYKIYRLAHEVAEGHLHPIDQSFASALLVRAYSLLLDKKDYFMAWCCGNEAKRLGAKDIPGPKEILLKAENNEKYFDAVMIALDIGDKSRTVINLRGYYYQISEDQEPSRLRARVQTLMDLHNSIVNRGYLQRSEPISKKIRELYAQTFPEKAE